MNIFFAFTLILGLLAIVPLVYVYILAALLATAELLLRRVAESSKGVLMGVSAVLTSIGRVLKTVA